MDVIFEKFICKHCWKAFKSVKVLKMHIKDIHEEQKLVTCHICDA